MRINKVQWANYYLILCNDNFEKKINPTQKRKLNEKNILYFTLCGLNIYEISDLLNIKIDRVREGLRNGKRMFLSGRVDIVGIKRNIKI